MEVSHSSRGSSMYPPPQPRDRDKSLPVPGKDLNDYDLNNKITQDETRPTQRQNTHRRIVSEPGRVENRENPT